MHSRHIVLREFTPLLNRTVTPSEEYLKTTDGSLLAEQFALRIDANGFLETGNPNRGEVPLYILGDSFSEAVFEHEELRFSSIVERNLIAAGLNFKVLNGSFSRATTLHMLNVLVNKVLTQSVAPGTTVVFFRPQIDLQVTDAPGGYWSDFGLYSPINPTSKATEDITHSFDHDLESSERLIHSMADLCERFGIRLIFGTAPARRTPRDSDPVLQTYFDSDEKWQIRMKERAASNQQVRQIALERGIQLIDADKYFETHGGGLYDFTHMNSEGQRMLAILVTQALTP